MTLSEENLNKEYEKFKQTTISSPCSSKAATVSSTNTLFFSLTKHPPTTNAIHDTSNINMNISNMQHLNNNLVMVVASLTDCQTILSTQTEILNTESMIEMFSLLYKYVQ